MRPATDYFGFEKFVRPHFGGYWHFHVDMINIYEYLFSRNHTHKKIRSWAVVIIIILD